MTDFKEELRRSNPKFVAAAEEGEKLMRAAPEMLRALTAIQQLMNGEDWSPDTLDGIAEILRQAGFEVRDTNQEEAE